MEKVKAQEKTRADYHAEFMEKLPPALINKVNRIVSQRRAMHAAMNAVTDQYLGAHGELKRLEGERALLSSRPAKGMLDEVAILDRRIEAAKLRMTQLDGEKSRLNEPYRVATIIGENVLETLRNEIGGGVHQVELFETLGWR